MVAFVLESDRRGTYSSSVRPLVSGMHRNAKMKETRRHPAQTFFCAKQSKMSQRLPWPTEQRLDTYEGNRSTDLGLDLWSGESDDQVEKPVCTSSLLTLYLDQCLSRFPGTVLSRVERH